MRVCLDTNTLLQLFGRKSAFGPIKRALLAGELEWVVSTAICLEYEEVIVRLSGGERWRQVRELLDLLTATYGNVVQAEPHFRFGVIAHDPDDNKFVDCAIAANADFVITSDSDFSPLARAGFRPKPISPEAFIAAHLPATTP